MKEGNALEAVKPIISQMRTTNSAPWWHHKAATEFLVTKPSTKARHQEEIISTHKSKHSSLQSPIYAFQCRNSKYFSPMVCRTGRSSATSPYRGNQVQGWRANRIWQEQTHSPSFPLPPCTGTPRPPALHLPSEAGELHWEISCCMFKQNTKGGWTILLLNKLISLSTYWSW